MRWERLSLRWCGNWSSPGGRALVVVPEEASEGGPVAVRASGAVFLTASGAFANALIM